jgi:hypothetical protein
MSLIGIVGCTLFVVYFIGLRQVIRTIDPESDWIARIVQLAGLLWVAMVFVPQSMEVGAAISRLLMGLFLIAFRVAVFLLCLLTK